MEGGNEGRLHHGAYEQSHGLRAQTDNRATRRCTSNEAACESHRGPGCAARDGVDQGRVLQIDGTQRLWGGFYPSMKCFEQKIVECTHSFEFCS